MLVRPPHLNKAVQAGSSRWRVCSLIAPNLPTPKQRANDDDHIGPLWHFASRLEGWEEIHCREKPRRTVEEVAAEYRVPVQTVLTSDHPRASVRSDYLFTNDSGRNRTTDRKAKERTKVTRCSQTRDVQAGKIGLKFGVEAGVSFNCFERIEDRRPVEKRDVVHIGAVTCGKDDVMDIERRIVIQ